MSLKRQLLVSFGVQGAGAASVLLATVWLGARMGPDVQGTFSRTKSEIEFLAAFAMFGLPQALFYHLKSGGLSTGGAVRWVVGSALLALPIGLAYAVLQHPGMGAGAWTLLALAVAATVAHGQLRSLLLVRERTIWFNAVTAGPQVSVLVGVAMVVWLFAVPSSVTWLRVFALASALSAAAAWWRLRAATVMTVPSAVGWRSLMHYGLAAWLTAALSTAAILTVQRWVVASQGRAALGQFTMAMTLCQVPLTPINYAAPLLFRRWMEQPGASASRRWAGLFFIGLLLAAALVALCAWVVPDLGLGAAYAGATSALALLLVGAAAEAASRVLTVQASATGLPWVAVRAELARWGVLGMTWLLLSNSTSHGLLAWCAGWSAAAAGAACVFAWHGRRVGAS